MNPNTTSPVIDEAPMETEGNQQAGKETKELAKDHTDDELKEQDRKDGAEKERRAKVSREQDKKRPLAEGASEPQSSHRPSSGKDQQVSSSESAKMVREPLDQRVCPSSHPLPQSSPQQEEMEEDFPFTLTDFVTVDEVGDVTDLPQSASVVAMDTTEGGDDALTSPQRDTQVNMLLPSFLVVT